LSSKEHLIGKQIFDKVSLVILILLFPACMDKNGKTSMNGDLYPGPLEIIRDQGISIPVYDFSGVEFFLNRKNDTTYLVNFWASWCRPCIQEMPLIELTAKNYSSKKLKVILVSLDFKTRIKEDLIPFIKNNNIVSKVILLSDPDANTWIDKVNPQWTGSIPATLIYNRNERKFFEGSMEPEELNNLLKSIIKK
jgi:thiol-disulfide isomerase/thioredoxin